MSGKLIGLIYFYVISAASLMLIVIGIFSVVNYAINVTQFDKYPLNYYQENCETGEFSYAKPYNPDGQSASMSAEERVLYRKNCEERVAFERKHSEIEDLKNAVTFTLVGLVLFIIHFKIARRISEEKK